jgi:hypothetical protein
MSKWRLRVQDGRKAGHPFSLPDLIIAATPFTPGCRSWPATPETDNSHEWRW